MAQVLRMNDRDVQIRRARADDIHDVRRCAELAYSKYVDRMQEQPAPMHADFARQISEGHVYVASNDHSLLGYVVFYTDGDHLHLESIAVLPEQSGLGIGKGLIKYVENAARQAGKNIVELYTNEAMTENLEMYPRLGYFEVERKKQAGFNRVFFRKKI